MLLAAENQDYFLYDKKKKGSLDAGGDIDFEGVKDLKQESHEKSSSSWAWTSAKGKGRTDETLRQSELVAAGNLVIEAAGKIRIDIPEVNAQTVTQTIDALVEAEPKLAWLKEMESRGDIDWQRVKEVHDQWKYSHSGMGAGLAIIVAIVVTVLTWGAASAAVGAGAQAGTAMAAAVPATATTAAVSAGWANVALTSAITSMASNAAINTINSGGDLGKALSATFSEEAMKGYLTSAVAAGITTGLIDSYFADKGGAGSGGIDVDLSKAGQASAGTTGPSFNLNEWSSLGKFAAYQGSKAVVSAGVDAAINGGSFEEKLAASLTSAAVHVVSAAAFNQVGNWAQENGINNGDVEKIAVKALVGGLISQAATGDFATGALAAGANEALSDQLAQLVKGDQALQATAAQLVGALAAGLTGGDANLASNIALYDELYNRQLHSKERTLIRQLAEEKAQQLCQGDSECFRNASLYWTDALERVAGGNIDDRAYAQNIQYLSLLGSTAAIAGTEGQMGGFERYFADLETAASMLGPYVGKSIAGTDQTYFSATQAQRADYRLNYVLGFAPSASIIPGMAERDQVRLDSFATANGSAQSVYPLEETVLGGMASSRVLSLLGRTWGALDVYLAGRVGTSAVGNISAQQMTREGMAASLNAVERNQLSTLGTLSSTAEQGAVREQVTNSYLARNGFTQLEGKCGSNNCFDGVFVKGDTVYLVETKPLQANGSIRLDNSTGNVQLDNFWISDAAGRLANTNDPIKQQTAALIQKGLDPNSNIKIVKIVSGVNENGITFVRMAK